MPQLATFGDQRLVSPACDASQRLPGPAHIHLPMLTFVSSLVCRRACIQEWAADELLSYSLADMLVMNDCLHAELERWEQVTQSLVLAQSMPMVSVQVPAPCFNTSPNHGDISLAVHICH